MRESPSMAPKGKPSERQALYMIRAPLYVKRIHYHARYHSVTVDGGKFHAGSKTGSFQSFSPSLPCTPFAALQVWSPIKAFTGAIVAASLSVKDVRTSQEDCGEGCAGEFRLLGSLRTGRNGFGTSTKPIL